MLNQIFNNDFRNGHLLVYIDDNTVFNANTTDNLLQIIFDLSSLLAGNHDITVGFTANDGKYTLQTHTLKI